MLPMASNHSIVTRFIEEKRQLKWGRVNQALASAMDKFLTDYSVSIQINLLYFLTYIDFEMFI